MDPETLGLIYEAAVDPVYWGDAIDRIMRSSASDGGQILLWDANGTGVAFSHCVSGASDPALAEQLYAERFGAIDPRRQHAMRLPVGRWLVCHQVFDDRFVAGDEFYQDYFIPILGARYMSGARLADQDGLHAMFAVGRNAGKDARPFDAHAVRYLEALTPHLMRASRLQLQVARLRGELDERNAAFDRLTLPILLVERDATIRFANAAAEDILQRAATTLVTRQARLTATAARDASALAAAIVRAVSERRGASVPLGTGGPAPLFSTVVPLSPRSELDGSRQRPMALVVLNDPLAAKHVDTETLSALFGLTPAEARIAAAVAAGESAAACAARLGISLLTARAHLRSVFVKLGVHRQAELASLLQRIAPAVRPSAPSQPRGGG